ncbi:MULTISPECIES: hypothetical protein [unclassified Streptomyces]|uniref:hypothetical protein n=1 Tax=unclassified Streptomyces TaxID=2593676 RepID=UPI00364E6E9E
MKTPRPAALVTLAVAGIPGVALLVAGIEASFGASPVQAPGVTSPAEFPVREVADRVVTEGQRYWA